MLVFYESKRFKLDKLILLHFFELLLRYCNNVFSIFPNDRKICCHYFIITTCMSEQVCIWLIKEENVSPKLFRRILCAILIHQNGSKIRADGGLSSWRLYILFIILWLFMILSLFKNINYVPWYYWEDKRMNLDKLTFRSQESYQGLTCVTISCRIPFRCTVKKLSDWNRSRHKICSPDEIILGLQERYSPEVWNVMLASFQGILRQPRGKMAISFCKVYGLTSWAVSLPELAIFRTRRL